MDKIVSIFGIFTMIDFHKIKIEDNNYLPNNYKYWL